ncbi:VTT domain-containing protein [Candidatus Woesearchaeota archaeon]|nr:VTT domain-containing protein [Candidatus Woesearchaeota archaeon]
MKEMRKKLLLFLLAVVSIVLIVEFIFILYKLNPLEYLKTLPIIREIITAVVLLLENKNYVGVYLFFASAALFFFPSPLELFYYGFLQQDFSFLPLYAATLLGILTAQHINYGLGRFFGKLLRKWVNEKTIAKYQRKIEKQGHYFILVMHAFPLPYAIFNFVVGLSHYRYGKWLAMAVSGLMFNFVLIYSIFLLF